MHQHLFISIWRYLSEDIDTGIHTADTDTLYELSFGPCFLVTNVTLNGFPLSALETLFSYSDFYLYAEGKLSTPRYI